MAGSAYYSLWLHNGTSWISVPNLQGLTFNSAMNMIGGMAVTVYTRDTALAALLNKAGVPYRIMNKTATSGIAFNESGGTAGNFVIQQGSLNQPSSDLKTSTSVISTPIKWDITGNETAEGITKMTFDNTVTTTDAAGTTQLAQQLSGGVGQMFKRTDNNANFGIIDNLNSSQQGRPGTTIISAGTIDTGPTAAVKFRQDNAWQMMVDLAGLGDTTTLFNYYLRVEMVAQGSAPNIKYIPKVSYISNQNSTYPQPNNTTGVKFTDPSSGTADPTRIIVEQRDTRAVNIYQENDRIKNAINIKYGGGGNTAGGTTAGQRQTGFALNSSSVTAFGRREGTVAAPWIQDSATAVKLQNTMLNVYSGLPNGLQRVEIVMKSGRMFSSVFNANLGDTVAVQRKDLTYIVGKFLHFEYNQSDESLLVVLGLPNMDDSNISMADFAATARMNQLSVGSLERVTAQGSSKVVNSPPPDTATYVDVDLTNLNISPNSFHDVNGSVSFADGITGIAFQTFMAVDLYNDGPIIFDVDISTTGGTRNYTFGQLVMLNPSNGTQQFTYPSPFGFVGAVTGYSVRVINNSFDDNLDTSNDAFNNRMRIIPIYNTVDFSHVHNQ